MKSTVKPTRRIGAIRSAVAAVIATAALVGCGGGGSGDSLVNTPGVALYTSAASQITVPSGTATSFTVGGGGGGGKFVSYQVTSSNTKVAAVTLEGTKVTVQGYAAGTALINVSDSAGANVQVAVTVSADSISGLNVAVPSPVTMAPGSVAQYRITGGVAPYSVVANNTNVVSVAGLNGVVQVTAANPGSATVAIYDAVGASTKFDLTVSGGNTSVALYTTAPASVSLPSNTTATYSIAGGTGPYTVTSSNVSLVDASASGNVLTLAAKGGVGTATVNIRDSQGVLITVNVSTTGTPGVPLYTTAPETINIGLGPAPGYAIQGGIGPYTASTSNASVAKVAVTGDTLNITGLSAGAASIVVFDSTGASLKTIANVAGGPGVVPPLYTTAPDSITVAVGATPTYTIAGGAGPYVVASSDVTVATVTQTDSTFTVKGIKAGNAVISVHDANGTPATILVTVQ
jgi:hypothetical protein